MTDPRFDNPPATPGDWLQDWIAAGRESGLREPTAMNLATVDARGRPSNRIVLFKGMRGDDVCFYTNYDSRKAANLASNAYAALCFWWDPLMRQLRLEGRTEKLTAAESDEYFAGRPRGSQIGAWASTQSHAIDNRGALEQRFQAAAEQFSDGRPVPRPKNWGGYRLVIDRIEFWQGQPNRFHDRMDYWRDGDEWQIRRLQP